LFETNSEKITSLQAGRAIAAIAVVVHHAALSTGDFIAPFPGRAGEVLSYGWLGVDFFFVLSGFIIYHTTRAKLVGPQEARSYARSRLTRIFVPFLPISIVLVLAYTWLPGLSAASRDWSLIASITLLPVGTPALSVAWTLQHELVFYAIFGLGFFAGQLWFIVGLWTALIAGALVLGLESGMTLLRILLSPVNFEFVFGIACAILTFRPFRFDGWLYGLVAVAAFATWGFLGFGRELSPIAALGIAALIIPVVRLELAGRLHVPNWAVFLGAASYSLYLIHNPLISITTRIAARVPALSDVYVAMVFSVVASIVAGCLYHLLIEVPAGKALRRRY
jgi:exopolysaccharide production protein ExoZ